MQAQGTRSYIAIQKETSFATNPSSPNLVKVPFLSESLSRSIELIDNTHIRGDRSSSTPVRGNTDVSGNISLNLGAYPGQLLLGVMGSVTTTDNLDGSYSHTMKVGSTLPSFTVEKAFPDISQYILYQGCKISKMSLTASPSGFQQASFDIMGAKATASGTSFDSTPTELTDAAFDGFRIASLLEGGSSVTNVTEVTLDIDNGLDGDTFVIGGNGQRGSLNEGLVKVTGTLNGFFENLSLYNKAVNQTETSLKLTYAFGDGDGTAGNESLVIEMPEVLFSAACPPIDGPRGIYLSLNFVAYLGNAATNSSVLMTLKNTQETI